MNNYQKTFEEQGYVLVKNFIPKDVAKYLFEYLKFSIMGHMIAGNKNAIQGDDQVVGSYTRGHGDLALDSLMKQMKPKMEEVTGLAQGGAQAVDAINELIEVKPELCDIQEGYKWFTAKAHKTLKYWGQLVGPTTTARSLGIAPLLPARPKHGSVLLRLVR